MNAIAAALATANDASKDETTACAESGLSVSSSDPTAPNLAPPMTTAPQPQYTPYQNQSCFAYPAFESNHLRSDARCHQLFQSGGQHQHLQPYPIAVVPQGWMMFRLKSQVEFYFSFENLVRDDYMVQQLLAHGGYAVPCYVVGNFPRVREILGGQCASPQILLQALQYSLVVCVQGDMLVPQTDALTQALHVRLQGLVYPAPTTVATSFDPLPSSSRYSPQTIVTDDTTTASAYSVGAMHAARTETPGGTVVTPEHFSPSLTDTSQPLETEAIVENWPVGVTQQPFVTCMPMYDVVQQVPYGYTVTTESSIPETPAQQEPGRRSGYLKKKRNKNQRKFRNRLQNQDQSDGQNGASGSIIIDKRGRNDNRENEEKPSQNNSQQNQLHHQSNKHVTQKNHNESNNEPQQNPDKKPQPNKRWRQNPSRGREPGKRKGAVFNRNGTDAGEKVLAQGLQGLSI